jgi:hypothetical protein
MLILKFLSLVTESAAISFNHALLYKYITDFEIHFEITVSLNMQNVQLISAKIEPNKH